MAKDSTYDDFSVSFLNVDQDKNNLSFEIQGDKVYGLDKSILNGIRRTLLVDIDTVAFNDDSIIINTNKSALHNEFLKHRITLIPLYIDPETYQRNYLFKLNVKITDEPVLPITVDMFNIYPLKDDVKELIDEQSDKVVSDEDNILLKLNDVSTEYYDLDSPINDSEKKKIFRPFEFNKITSYFLLTELKTTNSEEEVEEIELYCVPSIGVGKEHSKFNNLSTVVYSFKKNEEVFKQVLSDNIKIHKIKEKDISSYSKSLELSDGERYYHRDAINEPYWYDFKITSNHFLDSKDVFIYSINKLITRFTHIENNLNSMITEPENSLFSIENLKKDNDLTYKIILLKEDDTTGNMIQTHAVNKFISSESIVTILGYKKPHPLTNLIFMNIMIQNKDYSESQKVTSIIEFIIKVVKDLIGILDIIKTSANKKL